MKRFFTLLAAATLIASPFAIADNSAPSNPNDVLHQIPNNGNANVADTNTNAQAVESTADTTASAPSKPVKKHLRKHHRHHCKKNPHCKHHKKLKTVSKAASPKAAKTVTASISNSSEPTEIVIGPESSTV